MTTTEPTSLREPQPFMPWPWWRLYRYVYAFLVCRFLVQVLPSMETASDLERVVRSRSPSGFRRQRSYSMSFDVGNVVSTTRRMPAMPLSSSSDTSKSVIGCRRGHPGGRRALHAANARLIPADSPILASARRGSLGSGCRTGLPVDVVRDHAIPTPAWWPVGVAIGEIRGALVAHRPPRACGACGTLDRVVNGARRSSPVNPPVHRRRHGRGGGNRVRRYTHSAHRVVVPAYHLGARRHVGRGRDQRRNTGVVQGPPLAA